MLDSPTSWGPPITITHFKDGSGYDSVTTDATPTWQRPFLARILLWRSADFTSSRAFPATRTPFGRGQNVRRLSIYHPIRILADSQQHFFPPPLRIIPLINLGIGPVDRLRAPRTSKFASFPCDTSKKVKRPPIRQPAASSSNPVENFSPRPLPKSSLRLSPSQLS